MKYETNPFRFLPIMLNNPYFSRLILPLLFGYLVSVAGTWLSIWLARRLNKFDQPGERSSHAAPIPRFGGIGIALGLFAILLEFAPSIMSTDNDRAFIIGSLIALVFGLADDFRPLPPLIKLALQGICAAVPIILGAIPAADQVWEAALLFVWIVFFMNAFNFMDGMDGQTSTFGVLTCSAILFPLMRMWRVFEHAYDLMIVPIGLAGALLGFMRFNLARPARTFMGDGGSQMTGFVLALALASLPPSLILPAALAFAPFIYDVLFTLVRRSIAGHNILHAHRDHLYQLLLRSGMSHREVLVRTLMLNVVCLATSIHATRGIILRDAQSSFAVALAVVLLALIVYTVYVFWRRRHHGVEP